MDLPLEAFIEVKESWYGNYEISEDQRHLGAKLVYVRLSKFSDDSGFRVSVWGNDDFGMEKDFKSHEYKQAEELYVKILLTKFPTQEYLWTLNFVHA